jgi:profilin
MIGHHNESVQTTNAAAALEKVADYINGAGR